VLATVEVLNLLGIIEQQYACSQHALDVQAMNHAPQSPADSARALLAETKVEIGDVSKQKWNLCQLQVTVDYTIGSNWRERPGALQRHALF